MSLSKGQIRETAITILERRHCDVWPQNNLAVRGRKFIGRKGIADISGITTMGLRVECEVKAKGDTLRKEQIDFLTMIEKNKGIALLAIEDGRGQVVLVRFIDYINT
jgi:hypothetical protein